MIEQLSRLVVKYSWLVLAGLSIVTVVAALLAMRLQFDFSPQSMFAGHSDIVERSEAVKQAFGYEDALLLVILEATAERDVLDRAAIDWQAVVADEFAKLPRVQEVQSLARLERPVLSVGSDSGTRLVPLVRETPATDDDETRLRDFVKRSKLVEGSFLSDDWKLATIMVIVEPEARAADQMRPVLDSIEQTLGRHPPPDGYQVHLSGLPVLRVDIVKNLMADQAFLIPIAGALYLVALGLIFRGVAGTLLPLFSVGMGLVWTFAVLALIGQPLNLISNVLPMLLMIVGVSNSVHIVCRYGEEAEHGIADRNELAVRTIAGMATPCFITMLTAAVGFLSLWTANSKAMQEFGTQAAIGLSFLYFAIMLMLGASLPHFKPPRDALSEKPTASPISRAASFGGYLATHHPLKTLLAATVLALFSFWAARGIEINSFTIETYDEDHPTSRTLKLVEERLSGMLPLEIVLTTERPGQFLEAETYHKVAELERSALDAAAVVFGRSYVDLHQEVEASVTGNYELRDEIPPPTEAGQERIRRSSRFLRRVKDRMHYDSFMTNDDSQVRILLRVRDVGTKELLKVIEQLEAKLEQLFPPGSGITTQITGDAYLNTRAMDSMIRNLMYSLLTASVVIFAIIGILFRSLRAGLIAIIPNVTPLILTLGYMGLRGFDMNAGNVIVFTISLGIAVDNTVHFFHRFREEHAVLKSVPAAIMRVCTGTGRAILITNLLVVIGLAVLMFSDFVPTRRFAELTTVTMLSAVVGDLILLPVSLGVFWKDSPPATGGSQQTNEPQA